MTATLTAEFDALYGKIMAADWYLDIFPKAERLKQDHRLLATRLHPDRWGNDPKANEVFARLQELFTQANEALAANKYGEQPRVVVASKKHRHLVGPVIAEGDIATLYDTFTDYEATVLKVARKPGDNDLIDAEARALKAIAKDVDAEFSKYFPVFTESFTYKDDGGIHRRANVISRLDSDYVTLEQVRRAYPDGVHPLDMVWMYRRILAALGAAHRAGVLHGAVIPPHVMIRPDYHDVVLVDWCYSTAIPDSGNPTPLIAVPSVYRSWYPEEVLNKKAPGVGTDIYLATACMIYITAGNPLSGYPSDTLPKQMRAFFRGTTLPALRQRPSDAWSLINEFDELLERLGEPYFPRRFRPFTMP